MKNRKLMDKIYQVYRKGGKEMKRKSVYSVRQNLRFQNVGQSCIL